MRPDRRLRLWNGSGWAATPPPPPQKYQRLCGTWVSQFSFQNQVIRREGQKRKQPYSLMLEKTPGTFWAARSQLLSLLARDLKP